MNIFCIWHHLQVFVIDLETNALWFILLHEGCVLRLSVLLLLRDVQGGSSFDIRGWKLIVCDHSNKSYWAVLSCGTVLSLWIKPYCATIQMKAFEQYVHVVLFIMLYKVVLAFKSVDESPVCNHLNESYWAVFYLVLFIILFEVFLIVVETLVFDYLRKERKLPSIAFMCRCVVEVDLTLTSRSWNFNLIQKQSFEYF